MKVCTRCNADKKESEFNKDKSRGDGLDNVCRDCRKEWKKVNKEKLSKYHKQYRIDNGLVRNRVLLTEEVKKDRQRERSLRYYWENKDKVLCRWKEYYNKNKEEINRKITDYHRSNPEIVRKCNRNFWNRLSEKEKEKRLNEFRIIRNEFNSKGKTKEQNKRRRKRERDELRNQYVKKSIQKRTNISFKLISDEMVDLERNRLKLIRKINQLKS